MGDKTLTPEHNPPPRPPGQRSVSAKFRVSSVQHNDLYVGDLCWCDHSREDHVVAVSSELNPRACDVEGCRCELYGRVVSVEVQMQPVYRSPSGEGQVGNQVTENHIFGAATPSGKLGMMIRNPYAAEAFEVGQEWYLDFTLADA